MSEQRTKLNATFTVNRVLSPEYYLCITNLARASTDQLFEATEWILSKSTATFEKQDTFLKNSHTTVTFDEDQSHPNLYQTVEVSGLYHHTKFERNQSANVWIQANVIIFWWNHIIRVLSLEYWIDKIKWVSSLSDQHVSTVHNKFHPNP